MASMGETLRDAIEMRVREARQRANTLRRERSEAIAVFDAKINAAEEEAASLDLILHRTTPTDQPPENPR